MEIDKDGESFFLLLIMLITSIINDHVYLIVTFRLMQFDFNVLQFGFLPIYKIVRHFSLFSRVKIVLKSNFNPTVQCRTFFAAHQPHD